MSNPDQSPASPEPMFWVRLRSDGGYEGPIHNDGIERVRKESGGWTPLYPHVAPTEAAAMAATVPAGWQLVPIEPTKEMLHEGARRKYAWENGGGAGTAHAYKYFDETIKHSPSGEHCAEGMWRAILNAAPQAPVADQPAEPSPAGIDVVPALEMLETFAAKFRAALDYPPCEHRTQILAKAYAVQSALERYIQAIGDFGAAPKGDSNG